MPTNSIHQEEKGDRPDVSNIALIITDGKANTNTKNIIPEAEAAKKAGFKFVLTTNSESYPQI